MKNAQYTLQVKLDDDGSYWATIDELPGLFASGFTLDELHENVGETIPLYLADGKGPVAPVQISADLTVGEFQITVAA